MQYKSYLVEENFSTLKKNIALFYGENEGLKKFFKEKISSQFNSEEIIRLNQEEILNNKDLIYNEITNVSLFNKKKIIIIDNASDKIHYLLEDIKNLNKEDKIFIFSNLLDKKSKLRSFFEKNENCACVACYADNALTIKKIILNKLKNVKGLNAFNLNLIIENVGLDRIKLNNEIGKILIFFKDKDLNKEELEALLNSATNDDFNALKDQALIGNSFKTNKLLSETNLLDEKNVYYLSSINQRLNRIAEIKKISKYKNLEIAMNNLKPPIFWKDKQNFLAQAKKWDLDKIRKALNLTYEFEVRVKSNSLINKNILLKKLVIDICKIANS